MRNYMLSWIARIRNHQEEYYCLTSVYYDLKMTTLRICHGCPATPGYYNPYVIFRKSICSSKQNNPIQIPRDCSIMTDRDIKHQGLYRQTVNEFFQYLFQHNVEFRCYGQDLVVSSAEKSILRYDARDNVLRSSIVTFQRIEAPFFKIRVSGLLSKWCSTVKKQHTSNNICFFLCRLCGIKKQAPEYVMYQSCFSTNICGEMRNGFRLHNIGPVSFPLSSEMIGLFFPIVQTFANVFKKSLFS